MMKPVSITAGRATLHGDLTVPADPLATIVFAHGSGSSRSSSRNRAVAAGLVNDGFATLLFDLLTEDEERAERVTGTCGSISRCSRPGWSTRSPGWRVAPTSGACRSGCSGRAPARPPP
jgi:predicted alpha/beta-hydrolase family hydrolase